MVVKEPRFIPVPFTMRHGQAVLLAYLHSMIGCTEHHSILSRFRLASQDSTPNVLGTACLRPLA